MGKRNKLYTSVYDSFFINLKKRIKETLEKVLACYKLSIEDINDKLDEKMDDSDDDLEDLIGGLED